MENCHAPLKCVALICKTSLWILRKNKLISVRNERKEICPFQLEMKNSDVKLPWNEIYSNTANCE